MDDEGLDDFTRVRELLGLATGKDNGWYNLRVGELKAMLAGRRRSGTGADLDRVDHGIQCFGLQRGARELLSLSANPAAAERKKSVSRCST